jgi:flagellar basal-body rod protein FlgG
MLDAFFNALSGMRVASRRLEAGANNVANLQTPGFKKSQVDIGEMRLGGAEVNSISRLNTQGPILTTSNPIDLAVNGSGFFQVEQANGGIGYTRSGSFKIDGQGQLTTSDGQPLVPRITIPPGATALSIGSNGEVSAQVGGQTEVLGQIELANFNNPSGLSAGGGNILSQSGASGAPVTGIPGTGGFGSLISGGVEMSNVDIAEEAVDQITSKMAFQANINVIRTADKMNGALLDLLS